jgi:hypothetical protein
MPTLPEYLADHPEAAPAPVQHEHNFQEAAYQFLKRALPGVPVWSIDCGWPGHTERDIRIRKARWRRGVPSGLPDLWVMLYPIWTFETKAPKSGSLSDAQLDRRDELLRAGHLWFGPIRELHEIEACFVSRGIRLAATTGIVGSVPQVGARRLANWARLRDAVPDMRPDREFTLG